MLNIVFLDHRSYNNIHFTEIIFINLSAALSMCGKHHEHTHSTEKKHSGKEKGRECEQVQVLIQKTENTYT